MSKAESIFLVAFFKFDRRGSHYGFERNDLNHICKTEEEARTTICFCDEAGWYEGVLIEERPFGHDIFFEGKRIWFLQQEDGSLKEIAEPSYYSNIVNLIG